MASALRWLLGSASASSDATASTASTGTSTEPADLAVREIWIYPIKSAGGISVSQWSYTAEGFDFDRQWMLAEKATHKFITARTLPKIVLIETAIDLDAAKLTVTIPFPSGAAVHVLPLAMPSSDGSDGEYETDFVVWGSSGLDGFIVSSEELERDLNDFLGKELVLVRKGPGKRLAGSDEFVEKFGGDWVPRLEYGDEGEAVVSFADGFPFLLVLQSSLDDLDQHLKTMRESKGFDDGRWGENRAEGVEMLRFRGNVVIDGGEAWEEDAWDEIEFADARERWFVVSRCTRCTFPNIDPATAARDPLVPLALLNTFRLSPSPIERGKSCFGMNGVPVLAKGSVRVGEKINVLHRFDGGVRPEDRALE